jgi:prepilin-type N-terminal cleavage/methylation domain-containing protein
MQHAQNVNSQGMKMRSNKCKKKMLPGFTLLELLVALVITGLIVSVAGYGLFIVTKQFDVMKKENEKEETWSSFHRVVRSDFNRSEYINAGENSIQFTMHNNIFAEYRFAEDYCLRTAMLNTDTFHLSAVVSCLMLGKSVGAGSYIDMMKVRKESDESMTLIFNKNYSIAQLMFMERKFFLCEGGL